MKIIRHNWTLEQALQLYKQPFNNFLFQAHSTHRKYHDPNKMQISNIITFKTGACPEDCAYCGQSARHKKSTKEFKHMINGMMDVNEVVEAAKKAKACGATRFCMGGAWRSPSKREFKQIIQMITEVNKLALESCLTVGMLSQEQINQLDKAGLDYYNHNLDTSPEYYEKIITTRSYTDRLETIEKIRRSNIKLCCGGIIGMGESAGHCQV
ncbi:MAG: biotin synthase BioB [Gammaproteobacteria bacterium]|nr:biotin synthase BioB [Gammaproteobacteria bacterium]